MFSSKKVLGFISLCEKSIYRNTNTHLLTKTVFNQKPAELYSFYQGATKPNVHDNLVVLHGLFGSHTNFRGITKNPLISDQVNTYSLDLRNHGFSEHMSSMTLKEMGGDIVNYLEQKNLRNVILMGHSMGGRAIMSALEHYGKSLETFIKGVIICDISPGNQIQARTADVMEMWIMINSLLEINLLGKPRATIDQEVRKVIQSPQVANFMMMNVVEDENNPNNYKWRMNLKAIRDFYKENLATEIKNANFQGPQYVICGARSHFINQSKIIEFGNIFPNIDYDRDVYFIKGAGHWLHADKPVEFTEKISEFLHRIKNVHH